ncbi:hypothetical protein [Chromobacterium vaccinii]|uniref:hypothetical protein n=1 Tax=Chromobacterium vaccinii TaxID=1108595 RepID=UPI001E2B4699|nr:hypothetical protein [Chromobacterium vaccinii]MCD4501070.1 hypothetical protein [Chromobacterium vaccinii]
MDESNLSRKMALSFRAALHYGAAIHAIDPVDAHELRSLEQWLQEHSLHSPNHKP